MKVVDYIPKKFLSIFGNRMAPESVELLKWSGDVVAFIDRTGTLDLGVNAEVLTPLPALRPNSDTLAQCMDERAAELVAMDSEIAMYWSGGIDSTAALVALLRAGVRTDQMVVHYSMASVFEYPKFFEQFIKGKLPCVAIAGDVLSGMVEDKVIVTGELGDQIFGSVKSLLQFPVSPAEARAAHWTASVQGLSDAAVAQFEALIEKSPVPIENAYDFLWWVNFTCKWQHATCRMGNRFSADLRTYLAAQQHFFNSEPLQQWAMNPDNNHLKCGDTWNTYKQPAKDYIYEFTGDAVYRDAKKKVGSLPTAMHSHFLMLLDDGTRLQFGRSSDSPVAYAKLFGDRYDAVLTQRN